MRADPRFKPLPPEPATLLNEGRLIDAIKALRESQGIRLKQARDWIDWHIDQDPMLRAQLEARQRETRRKFFFWFLVIDALIVAAVIAWFLYTPR
jgi:hypothetical protein